MARRPRNLLPDSYYHITQKCNLDAFSFEDATACSRYLELLHEVFAKYSIPLLAYCLMLNHIHLLVKTGEDTRLLSCAMRELSGRLAAEYNRRHGIRGHFWAERYHTTYVAPGAHLRNVLAYIDANPLNTRSMEEPAKWRFCSYHELQAASATAEASSAEEASPPPQAVPEEAPAPPQAVPAEEAPKSAGRRPRLDMEAILGGGLFGSRQEFLSWQRAQMDRQHGRALVEAARDDRHYSGHFALGSHEELGELSRRLSRRGVDSYLTHLRDQTDEAPALWALDLCGPAFARRKLMKETSGGMASRRSS